jgi:hypothetical protein
LKAEQDRIETERAKAQQWADAADRETSDVMGALEDALILLEEDIALYEALPTSSRRLVNQAIYLALIVRDPETIEAQRTPLYDAIVRLTEELQQARQAPATATSRPKIPGNKAKSPQDDHGPESRGRGSYIAQMAERAGFEPAMEFNPHTRLAGECLQPLGHLSSESDRQCRAWRRATCSTRSWSGAAGYDLIGTSVALIL